MRLTTLAVIGAVACLNGGPALAFGSQDIYGVWRQPDSSSLIQIYPCDGSVCAKVVSAPDPTVKDVKNPNPALRDRPILGIETWRHAKETAPLQWSGSAYSPLDGATLYGTLHLTSETALVVASCNLEIMPCSERTWTKVAAGTPAAFTTLVSQSGPVMAGQPQEALAGKITAPKPRLPYVYKARKRKVQGKNKPGSPGDDAGDDFFSRIHIW